ncbi:MAG: hypothetical protein WC209_09385 [Ignavibacteriaceae bacterium]
MSYNDTLKFLKAVNIFNSYENIVILLSLTLVLIIGLYSARKVGSNYPAYFFANKKESWISVGLSLFAVNSFSEYFLIAVSLSFFAWWAIIPIEIVSMVFLFFFGYYLLPMFIKEKTATVNEIFEKLFNKKARLILSALSIISSLSFKLSLILLSAGILFYDILGWNFNAFILLMLLISGIFTVAGGLTSIIKIQFFQFALLLISTILLVIFGITKFGNLDGIFSNVSNSSFNFAKLDYLGNVNWIEIILFAPIAGFWYWYTDQHITQRILAGSDYSTIKKGITFSFVLKLIPIVFFASLGLIASALTTDISWDKIFSTLINSENFSETLRLVILFSLSLVLVQSFSSILISTSTLITVDFFESHYGITNGNKLVLIGRFTIFIIVISVIFLIPFVDLKNPQLYINLLRYQIYTAAPLAAVFAFVFFYKRITYAGMLAGLIIGEAAAIFRIVIELYAKSFSIIEEIILPLFYLTAFQVSIIIFLLSSSMILLISHLKFAPKIQLINLFRKV